MNLVNKESEKNIFLLMQTVLATAVFSIGLGYIFEKSYFVLLVIVLALLVFLMAYSNYRFYKIKAVTPVCIIFGIILILELFI